MYDVMEIPIATLRSVSERSNNEGHADIGILKVLARIVLLLTEMSSIHSEYVLYQSEYKSER